jgi:hypothetical protein
MQRNGAAPLLLLFLSDFLSHRVCPQSLLRLRLLYGRPRPVYRTPAIGHSFRVDKNKVFRQSRQLI